MCRKRRGSFAPRPRCSSGWRRSMDRLSQRHSSSSACHRTSKGIHYCQCLMMLIMMFVIKLIMIMIWMLIMVLMLLLLFLLLLLVLVLVLLLLFFSSFFLLLLLLLLPQVRRCWYLSSCAQPGYTQVGEVCGRVHVAAGGRDVNWPAGQTKYRQPWDEINL